MPADKTVGEEEQTGRRRRSLLGRSRPEAEEPEPDEELDDESEERGVTAGKGRATPSRRRQEEAEEESGNVATRTVGGLREYFEGVRSELGKVIWPTREEAQRLTLIVLVTLLVSSLVLGAISLAFTELFRIGLGSPIILLVLMLVGVIGGFYFLRAINRRPSY